MAYEVAGGKYR